VAKELTTWQSGHAVQITFVFLLAYHYRKPWDLGPCKCSLIVASGAYAMSFQSLILKIDIFHQFLCAKILGVNKSFSVVKAIKTTLQQSAWRTMPTSSCNANVAITMLRSFVY
jgi:hypothetical protein